MTSDVMVLEPVVSWPREVELGRSYLVTVDIRSAGSMESWPYDEEQFELSCVLDAQPYLDANVVDDPVLILHRFGGTYRPVRFAISARHLPEQDGSTEIWLSYVNRWGVVLRTVSLPLTISSRQDVTAQPSDLLAPRAAQASDGAVEQSSPTEKGPAEPTRYRVCELYAAGPEGEGSGSGYRLSDRLVLTAWHVIAPATSEADGQLMVRAAGVSGWRPARVEWADASADAALVGVEDEGWPTPGGEPSVRWGQLEGSDPVPCVAAGFPWASVRPDRMRDTAHVYGQLAPLGQVRQGRLDLDVISASPSARDGGSPWAGMSGAGVIADSHLVGVITVDPAGYQSRLVAVPVGQLLADSGFQAVLANYGVPAEAEPVGAGWCLRLPGGQTVSLAPAYRPISPRVRPEPSILLRPEHGLVPFLGRQAELAQIATWCQDVPGSPVLLVTGAGGWGKTRLGREACVQMLVAGWDAGFADDTRADGAATDRLERPTLLVVDDADLRTGLVSALFDYLRRDDTGPPLRLLLLARTTGDWWDRLVRQRELDSSYSVLDLDRHPVPPADRVEHFRRASAAFAAYGDSGARPVDLPTAAELDDPAYAEPLLIHIAALLRTMDRSATAPPSPDKDIAASQPGAPIRQRLLQTLCERERTRWHELAAQSHLSFNPDLPVADQVVALATLTAAANQACATSLLAALPNQAEVTRIGAAGLVEWAHRLYAGPSYWNPLQPNLLAEQHLADTAELPALATNAAQTAVGQSWEAALLTQELAQLTHGAPNQPAILATLSQLLAATLPRIIEFAVGADSPQLADLASLALQIAPQPDLAAQLADQMPEYSVRLAALAATLTSQQVTQYRAGAVDGQPDTVSRLAGSLNALSNRLADLGRREDALAAAQEAVTIRRQLAAANPDAFEPDLASSLNNLAHRLADLGRPEDALAAVEQAVIIRRQLAAANPDASLPDLASSLNNLALRLADLGRPEDALAAAQEAVAIRRQLAAANPDAFRPDLASSLNNLALRLAEVGRPEDALAAAQEAVAIRRELAAASPDAFLPDLAESVNNLALRLAEVGRPEDALAAIQETVAIRRELAAARPDAFLPDLAESVNNLALRLADLGRPEDALAAIQETVAIRRELAAARPDAFLPDLAESVNNLALRLADLGRPEDALAAAQEAVTIRRELAARWPDIYPDALVQLAGSERASLPDIAAVGSLDTSVRTEVTVVIRRRAELPGEIVEGPTVLTSDELAERYGADPADVAVVRQELISRGLLVTAVHSVTRRIKVEGTLGNLSSTFGTTLRQVSSPDPSGRGRVTHRYREGPLYVPAALDGVVTAVLGLDTRPQARPLFRPRTGAVNGTSYPPNRVADIYQFPAGTTGVGQTVAVIELGGGFSTSDLDTYFSGLGIPTPSVTAISVDGAANSPGSDPNGADVEVNLDIDVIGAAAPGVAQVVYFAPNNGDQSLVDAISDAAQASPAPIAISISWGQSEDSWTAQGLTAMNQAMSDAAALGITVCVAAGDNGGIVGVSDGQVHVDFPASSPYALACGGTRLLADPSTGVVSSEVVWNEMASNEGATGGGVSDRFALPSWQADAGVPARAAGNGSGGWPTGRGVPDVAGNADPATGYQIYFGGQALVVGGTSAVAPLWSALIARLAQATGQRFGLIQPLLYAGVSPGADVPGFRDITSGNNGAYSAGPGWDACTGLGSPDGAALLARLTELGEIERPVPGEALDSWLMSAPVRRARLNLGRSSGDVPSRPGCLPRHLARRPTRWSAPRPRRWMPRRSMPRPDCTCLHYPPWIRRRRPVLTSLLTPC